MDPAIATHPHDHAHPPVPAPAAEVTRRQRLARVAALAATAGVTAYVGFTDPAEGGVYPLCPSQVVLGVDCPACGGLRGTHDLLNGDVAGALGHNLLLPVMLLVVAVTLALWMRPLVGRPARPVRTPRWLVASGAVVAVAFTVLRNLPVAGLEFLSSG
jgi:hypothetical protein